jgi:hypothetical protein
MNTKLSYDAARNLARRILEKQLGAAATVESGHSPAFVDDKYCEAFEIALEALLSAKVGRIMARCIADEVAAEYVHQ